jgi:hypothetical protein
MQDPASELRRIPLLGSRVNKGSRSPDSYAPTAPARSHLALELSLCLSSTSPCMRQPHPL